MVVDPVPGEPATIREIERGLWRCYQEDPSPDLQKRLVDHYLPYVRGVAARYFAKRGGLEADFGDYLQLAIVGLLESIERFDPSAAIGFISYAQHRIEGSILNGLPKLSEQHAQIDFQKRLARERVNSLLGGERGHRKTNALFDEMVNLTIGLGIGFMLEGSGLYQNAEASDEYDGYASTLMNERKRMLLQQLEGLPAKERHVLKYHYLFNFSFEDIAAQLELSKGRVSQLHRQALLRLRDLSKNEDVLDVAF